MGQLARVVVQDRVGTVTLHRPEARNALSIELLHDLHRAVEEVAGNDRVSVVVFTGEGRSFCAGMDLKAVLDDSTAALTLLSSLANLCAKIRALPAVTVAKVNGAAIGGGCGLATVCDISLTHADSKMGFPEVDLGVCPAVVAPWLVRKIGSGRARRVLLEGGLMSGERAFQLGMVDHLAPTLESLGQVAEDLVARLASGGPAALRATKELLNRLDDSMNEDLARRGAELSARVLQSQEAQSMLRAKISK